MYFDIHMHLLYGVDDGPSTREDMLDMLDLAYADGTRAICVTPHHAPSIFGVHSQEETRVFSELCSYAKERYPDLYLYRGQELGYYGGCLEALAAGQCQTLNGGRYVLVDFPEVASFLQIRSGVMALQRAGYLPVLAHVERYRALAGQMDWLHEFARMGGILQVNAGSAAGTGGLFAKHQWKRLMHEHLVHAIASDGHNCTTRRPSIGAYWKILKKYCTDEELYRLTWDNPCRIVGDLPIEP